MKIISLLTDFGTRDGFVGVMKGVIWGIAPSVQIADISHEIQPQNILHGALILGQSWHYFPSESIHVAVVDPGVGTHRRAIAARIGEHYFIAPDNGLITIPLEKEKHSGQEIMIVSLENTSYWLRQVSRSFHGRDIFAPVAAHIANGVALEALGPWIEDPVRLTIPKPQPTLFGYRGQVMLVDVFGNLVSNIDANLLTGVRDLEVSCGAAATNRFVATFGEARPGELIAMIDSSGWLSLCVVNGNAAAQFKVQTGDPVEVKIKTDQTL